MKCARCKRNITQTRGTWFSDDDDFMCPYGEEQHSPVNALAELLSADSYRAWVDASEPEIALRTWKTVRLKATNTGSSRTGPDRRERAADINALKRAIERASGFRLVKIAARYSETQGFLHLSTFTYEIHGNGAS